MLHIWRALSLTLVYFLGYWRYINGCLQTPWVDNHMLSQQTRRASYWECCWPGNCVGGEDRGWRATGDLWMFQEVQINYITNPAPLFCPRCTGERRRRKNSKKAKAGLVSDDDNAFKTVRDQTILSKEQRQILDKPEGHSLSFQPNVVSCYPYFLQLSPNMNL